MPVDAEILSPLEFERCLGHEVKLVMGSGPPFCTDLERHFVRGELRATLRDVLLDVFYLKIGERGLHHVMVGCGHLERRFDWPVDAGVVCDSGLFAGFFVREYQIGCMTRFLAGRVSYTDNGAFNDWLSAQNVERRHWGPSNFMFRHSWDLKTALDDKYRIQKRT